MSSTPEVLTPSLLDLVPVVPVVVVEDLAHAVPVAEALVRGGLPVIELTLRTPVALQAVARIAAEVPDIRIGAGTVTTPAQAEQAWAAGAQFLVSPGATPGLLEAMEQTGLPFLPGVATVSEALAALERGHSDLKFFPAAASGGTAFLSSVAGPLPDVRFCPTGGITVDSAPDYLALGNVGCVGGSWITPRSALAEGRWDAVSSLASDAAALAQ